MARIQRSQDSLPLSLASASWRVHQPARQDCQAGWGDHAGHRFCQTSFTVAYQAASKCSTRMTCVPAVMFLREVR
jgi:hypothetical protein